MDKEQKEFFELSLSYSCLYSLLVKKGVITSNEYIEHSKLLKSVLLVPFKKLDDADEFIDIIDKVYNNIAIKAK